MIIGSKRALYGMFLGKTANLGPRARTSFPITVRGREHKSTAVLLPSSSAVLTSERIELQLRHLNSSPFLHSKEVNFFFMDLSLDFCSAFKSEKAEVVQGSPCVEADVVVKIILPILNFPLILKADSHVCSKA